MKRIYAGLGVLAGLVLGAAIAIVREMLDMSVRNPQTASTLLNAPVIGVIDYDPETKKNPLLIGDTALSVRAESFRQLRTNLQFIDATRSADVLLLTSSVPDEGKSLTSANLAISFVEFGDRVLLIEADLRRPSLWSYFGVERDVGLTNVLVGQMELSEAIQPWGNDGLFILPSGSLPPNPAELLGSRAMVDVIAELRPAFDKIIIDTPPLLPVTDAALCSAAADGVVLIIRTGKTHRSQVTSAVNALNQVNARMLGSILNMRQISRSEKRRYAAEAYYDGAFDQEPETAAGQGRYPHDVTDGATAEVMLAIALSTLRAQLRNCRYPRPIGSRRSCSAGVSGCVRARPRKALATSSGPFLTASLRSTSCSSHAAKASNGQVRPTAAKDMLTT